MANSTDTYERVSRLAREIFIHDVYRVSVHEAFESAAAFIAEEDRRAADVQEQRKREVTDLLSRSAYYKGGCRRG